MGSSLKYERGVSEATYLHFILGFPRDRYLQGCRVRVPTATYKYEINKHFSGKHESFYERNQIKPEIK